MSTKSKNFFALSLLFIQPIFMASNLVVARGGVEYIPPISLAFWRWTLVFLILLPFTYLSLKKNYKIKILKKKLYVLNMENNISSLRKEEQQYFFKKIQKGNL